MVSATNSCALFLFWYFLLLDFRFSNVIQLTMNSANFIFSSSGQLALHKHVKFDPWSSVLVSDL